MAARAWMRAQVLMLAMLGRRVFLFFIAVGVWLKAAVLVFGEEAEPL